jgi:hypothetical protein
MDVRWMLKRLGPPTFFCHLFHSGVVFTINSDVPNVEQMMPSELCAMDPNQSVSISIKNGMPSTQT